MPAWKTRLHPNEVVLVASYLVSLRGSMPEGGGKDSEGNKVAPWTAGSPGVAGAAKSGSRD